MPANNVSKFSNSVQTQVQLDKEAKRLVAERTRLKEGFHKQDDTIAEQLAKVVYGMKVEKMNTLGTNPRQYREEFMEWGKEVGVGNENAVTVYARIGKMFHNQSHAIILEGKPLTFRALEAISQKDFTDIQMKAFGQFLITSNKPVSAAMIHDWAWEKYKIPKPKKREKEEYIHDWSREATMELRLEHSPPLHGGGLLGIGPGTAPDVIKILGKHFRHQYHADKGGNQDHYERINEAVEGLKNNE